MFRLGAIWTGKAVSFIGRIMGRKSTSAPGAAAMKIYPRLVSDMNKRIRKKVIVTCGTNGKTTTNNVICKALETKGYKVLCNRIGANMPVGIATAYLEATDWLGRVDADYACLEVDEAYARIIFKDVKPDVMVITNLFRDQLDRYGELDGTISLIKDAIALTDGVTLVLNADDPVCVQFSKCPQVKETLFYGVSERVLENTEQVKEGRFCPICGEELSYNYYHYSQLGDFYCEKCGYKRPTPDFTITNVSLKTPMCFSVNGEEMRVNYKGFYNVMNLGAVYSALRAVGESTDSFPELLKDYKPQIGRMQEFDLGKPIIMSLSKNPAGFNQAIDTVNRDERKKDVIIAINDNAGDGRDVSWLWDVSFDRLKNDKLETLALTGIRRFDLGLRFKYGGVTADTITDNMKNAVLSALDTESEVVYIMVNYTAMYPTDAVLKELEREKGNEN